MGRTGWSQRGRAKVGPVVPALAAAVVAVLAVVAATVVPAAGVAAVLMTESVVAAIVSVVVTAVVYVVVLTKLAPVVAPAMLNETTREQDGGRIERAQLCSHAHPGSRTPAGAGEQQRTQKQRERREALPSTKTGAMPRPKAAWGNAPGAAPGA
ncbi:hypothetical protein NDU88_002511 [Pleurodeles waltl]|uniref:Uncharacterized protein n=1 Tax=Pleurodeles waltl TaxID=8319 RepID=A0AAV7MVX6_PLEWA|nr:hypothetical protein NDU88_002511 [Pleurodeles waltl]